MPLQLISASAWSDSRGDFTARVVLLNEDIDIDEKLSFTVVLAHPVGYEVNGELLGSSLVGEEGYFRIVSQEVSPVISENGMVNYTIYYEIEPQRLGELAIGLAEISFRDIETPGKEGVLFYSKVFPIKVRSIELTDYNPEIALLPFSARPFLGLDSETILLQQGNDKDYLENLQKMHFPFSKLFIMIILAVVVWLSRSRILGCYRSFKMRYHIDLSPRDIALRAINMLKKKGLDEKGDWQGFYMELTSIVRHYIEDEYRVRAPAKSTEEFLLELRDSNVLHSIDSAALEIFMIQADLIKFAKQNSSLEESRKAIQYARNFIN